MAIHHHGNSAIYNLGHLTECFVLRNEGFSELRKCARRTIVSAEFRSVHTEAGRVFRHFLPRGKEDECSVRIDETEYEPRRCNAVKMRELRRCPPHEISSRTTSLVSTPIPAISTSTVSPARR